MHTASGDTVKTRANVDAFTAWLNGVQLTKPVTLDDKKELLQLVKQALVDKNASVEAFSRRDPDEIYLYINRELVRTFRAI